MSHPSFWKPGSASQSFWHFLLLYSHSLPLLSLTKSFPSSSPTSLSSQALSPLILSVLCGYLFVIAAPLFVLPQLISPTYRFQSNIPKE
jgi:hypothetical protein